MEPTAAIAIGIVAATTAVVLGVRLVGRRRRTARVDPAPAPAPAPASGPRVLRPSRIVVVGDPRPSTGLRPEDASGVIGPSVDPRRRLLRDASAVLLAFAVLVLAISMLPSAAPSGEVLSVIATPATAGRPSPSGTSPAASGRATPFPSAASSARPPASAAARPPASAIASPAARSASPSRGPSAKTGAPAIPSPSRLALLTPCPGRSGCYLYVVRTGDTLSRIADFFGVSSATILRLNPAIVDPAIVVRGSTIVLPTPTR